MTASKYLHLARSAVVKSCASLWRYQLRSSFLSVDLTSGCNTRLSQVNESTAPIVSLLISAHAIPRR